MKPFCVLRAGLALAAPLLLSMGTASAVTVVVRGNTDSTAATIRNDTANNNFGADGVVIVGTTATNNNTLLRSVLSFNVPTIPVGATIDSVTLTMRQSGPDGATSIDASAIINLHLLTGTFSEGAGTSSGVNNGDVSWNFRGPSSAVWTTPGGDFSATVLSSITANPETAAATVHTFGSSADFISAVQGASGGTLSLLMKLATEAPPERRVFLFTSDENGTVSQTPTLTINYTIPEPGSVALAALAGVGLLIRRRRN